MHSPLGQSIDSSLLHPITIQRRQLSVRFDACQKKICTFFLESASRQPHRPFGLPGLGVFDPEKAKKVIWICDNLLTIPLALTPRSEIEYPLGESYIVSED